MVEQIPDSVLGKPFVEWEMTIKNDLDLKMLYIRLTDFLIEEKCVDLQGGGDDFETHYAEYHQSDFVNHSIWWRAKRKPDFDGGGYYMYWIYIDIDTFVMKKKEKIIDGNKVELDSGEMRFKCMVFIEEGHGKMGEGWENNGLLKFYKQRFWDRDHRHLSACKKQVNKFSEDLYNLIRTFAGVQPEEDVRDFVPVKGIHH